MLKLNIFIFNIKMETKIEKEKKEMSFYFETPNSNQLREGCLVKFKHTSEW